LIEHLGCTTLYPGSRRWQSFAGHNVGRPTARFGADQRWCVRGGL